MSSDCAHTGHKRKGRRNLRCFIQVCSVVEHECPQQAIQACIQPRWSRGWFVFLEQKLAESARRSLPPTIKSCPGRSLDGFCGCFPAPQKNIKKMFESR